jgi:hypothetical protein
MIQLLSKTVKEPILADVNKAGYFSLSVDSTPDISHIDQLTFIMRYVSPEDGLPSERFLTFLELKDHSGERMADLVFNYLTTELEINFNKCRGQSYANAANMAGRYNSMQLTIIKKNISNIYSMRSVVDCCLDAVKILGLSIKFIYSFQHPQRDAQF